MALAAAGQPSARQDILERMQAVMGPLPINRTVLPAMRVVKEGRFIEGQRLRIDYLAESGDRVPAWLFIPLGVRKPRPAIVCLHQTTRIGKDETAGLGGKPELHLALELAQRGYVTIAPDYPNFGEYPYDPYVNGYTSATMKGIWNHMRAIDVLQSLPEVDGTRIGAVGHSLGGHNALFLAAFDARVKAVVSSCGFTSFEKYMKGDLTGWSHRGYMPLIADVYGKSPARMPFDFSDVLQAIQPRAIFINAPLRDSNFDASGVDDSVRRAGGTGIVVVHPDAGHSFPDEVREQAWNWLEAQLLQNQP